MWTTVRRRSMRAITISSSGSGASVRRKTRRCATKQEAKRKKLEAYVDRWRYKAHTARQAQSRLKALQRMAPAAEVFDDASLVFDFPSPKEVKPPLSDA